MGLGGQGGTVGTIKRLPVVRDWWRAKQVKRFLSRKGTGLHYGVFRNFSEAQAWLPATEGFEREDFSDEYINVRSHRVYGFDYPILFWLREAFNAGAQSIFDIGGSVGVHYYAYGKFLAFPPALAWHVCELPKVNKLGAELAQRHGVSALTFTDSMDTSEVQLDIWIAAGALEFIEGCRPEALLAKAKQRPGHFFINKLPLHDGEDFVSTQNIGSGSFVAHHVYNRARYVAGIEAMGYRLIDSWDVCERSFIIPGEPEHSFDSYSGLYFKRVG